jgi:hypothetical protein
MAPPVTVVADQGTLTPFDRFGANLTRKLWTTRQYMLRWLELYLPMDIRFQAPPDTQQGSNATY